MKKEEKKEKNMHQRTMKVIFAKDGKGGVTPKISIPITWLRDMGITDLERGIELQYDEKNKVFFVMKENTRKDVNLTYEFNEKEKTMTIKKKYNDGKQNLWRAKLKARNIKIKGYNKKYLK